MTMTTQGETIALQKAEAASVHLSDSTESTEAVEHASDLAKQASNTSSLVSAKTPPRPTQNHSYAHDPHSTPIASTKRPRAANVSMGNGQTNNNRTPMSTSNTPMQGPNRSNSTRSMADMSPMHGPTPVEDKVEEIFSPTAHYLNVLAEQPQEDDDGDDANANHLNISDDDISMTPPEQPADTEDFNPWQFIHMLPLYDSVKHTRPPITLPAPTLAHGGTLRKSLVLDLDETLVHCSVEAPETPADFTFPVDFHGITYTVHVRRRPGLDKFLRTVSQHFEVILFTASQKVYADTLLDILDPENKYFHHRLFRESCLAVEGNFLKDLTVTGRDMSTTVLVDNSPHAFGYQVDNGIPIESWFDCKDDTELTKLERFLMKQVLPAEDVRVPVRDKFQSHHLVDTAPSMF